MAKTEGKRTPSATAGLRTRAFPEPRVAKIARRYHDGRVSSGGDVPCVDVLRAALTAHLTATGIWKCWIPGRRG
jgi:hypothetical protein